MLEQFNVLTVLTVFVLLVWWGVRHGWLGVCVAAALGWFVGNVMYDIRGFFPDQRNGFAATAWLLFGWCPALAVGAVTLGVRHRRQLDTQTAPRPR